MSSPLAVQIFLFLLLGNIFLRDVRGLAGMEFFPEKFRAGSEDFKHFVERIKNFDIKTKGKWEVVCEGEKLFLTCDAGEVINIKDAEYGRNDATTCISYPHFNSSQCINHWDTLYRVKQRCHNKRRCSINSSNDEFGNPCPNMVKYLKVKYVCEPVQSAIRESLTICEGGKLQIDCQNGASIIITDALYGRKDRTTCCCRFMNSTNCMSSNALDILSARCDYKESCSVEAVNQEFGDPCIGTIKYLQVDYLCVRDKVQHVRNCEGMQMKLQCKENSFIDVIDAHYGRANPFSCLNTTEPFLKEGCTNKDITSSVKERFNNNIYRTYRFDYEFDMDDEGDLMNLRFLITEQMAREYKDSQV